MNDLQDTSGNLTIILPGIKANVIRHCLRVLYTGSTNTCNVQMAQNVFSQLRTLFRVDKLSMKKVKKSVDIVNACSDFLDADSGPDRVAEASDCNMDDSLPLSDGVELMDENSDVQPSFHQGQEFKTYNEFLEAFDDYCKQHSVRYSKIRSCKRYVENSFSRVTFGCYHRPIGCPFECTVAYTLKAKLYTVKTFIDKHKHKRQHQNEQPETNGDGEFGKIQALEPKVREGNFDGSDNSESHLDLEEDKEFSQGQTYQTYDKFMTAFNNYCKDNSFQSSICRSVKGDSEEIPYSRITFCCGYNSIGCPFECDINYDKADGQYKIVNLVVRHAYHPQEPQPLPSTRMSEAERLHYGKIIVESGMSIKEAVALVAKETGKSINVNTVSRLKLNYSFAKKKYPQLDVPLHHVNAVAQQLRTQLFEGKVENVTFKTHFDPGHQAIETVLWMSDSVKFLAKNVSKIFVQKAEFEGWHRLQLFTVLVQLNQKPRVLAWVFG